MTLPPLPAAFLSRMEKQLGTQAEAYFAAMEQPHARGLRMNPRKPIPLSLVEGVLDPIPWEPNGFYLSLESAAGSHPLHEAGAYYLQEPSAMIPARVLAPRPGERVLDLCAAPGGKSTQLAALLEGSGLLVCNEPVPSRAQVLSRNIERMGITNALVVSADPTRLAERWPCAFDAILVDAPCSGEGMFRRHPETRLAWTETAAEGCAQRQRHILESAYGMLKPLGRLVYSTCTFNPQENEEAVAGFLTRHPALQPIAFSISLEAQGETCAANGMLQIYPHHIAGEGHFIALLQKGDAPAGATGQQAEFLPPWHWFQKPSAPLLSAYETFRQDHPLPMPNAMMGDLLFSAPHLPPLAGIKVYRAGLSLGALKGKTFLPDHALAMGLPCPPGFPTVALTLAQARAYQRGESLAMENLPKGFALAAFQGLVLGFGKGSDGQLKNHYPKGLRRP